MIRKCSTVILALGVAVGFATTGAQAQSLSIASFSEGSTWFAYSTRLAEILRDELDVQVDAPPRGGGITNALLVSQGKYELGFGMAGVSGWALEGTVAYDEPVENIRALIGGLDQYYGAPLALDDGGEPTLQGYFERNPNVNVVLRGRGSAGGMLGEIIFNEAGILEGKGQVNEGRVDFVDSFSVVKDALSSGRSQLWLHTITAGHPTTTDIGARVDITFLQPSEAVLDALAESGWARATMPASTFDFQERDFTFPGTTTAIFASTEMSADRAYAITKAICENEERFKAVHAALSDFSCAEDAYKSSNTVLPLHEGAKRYYAEQGWIEG